MPKSHGPTKPSADEPKSRWADRYRMINRKEAQALGFSQRFLELAALTGDGPPFIKLGRSVRYRVGDLLDFIDQHRFTSTSEVTERKLKAKDDHHG